MGEGSSGKSGGIQRFAMSLNKPLHMPMSLGSDGDSGFGWAAFRVRLIFYLPKTTYLVYYNSLGCPNNHQKKRSVPPGDNSSCPRGVTKKGYDSLSTCDSHIKKVWKQEGRGEDHIRQKIHISNLK